MSKKGDNGEMILTLKEQDKINENLLFVRGIIEMVSGINANDDGVTMINKESFAWVMIETGNRIDHVRDCILGSE